MCGCDRLHLDEVSPLAAEVARWAWRGLRAAERRNGTRPKTAPGTIPLIELMAASASATPEAANFYVGSATAASLLGDFPGAGAVARWRREVPWRGEIERGVDHPA